MAHESFEDPASAAVMNELFVNIKVDREERPDLDKIYQLAQQMLTQRSGGWPLTMFLTPGAQRPFFGGTYFPKEPRYGMPAFTDLLHRVSGFYRSHREDIAKQSEALQQAFAEMSPPAAPADAPLTLAPLAAAREKLAEEFDPQFGGFGAAPKFPHPTNIEFLLRQWRATAASDSPDLHSLYMATLTLKRMAEGGIYDHLGGGFARYSVDQYWMIPHFEKMLYDNGQLLRIYANAALATGDELFRRVTTETAEWIVRDMQAPGGGYWSTLDADSEGHEGKFYVWDEAEVRALLPAPGPCGFRAALRAGWIPQLRGQMASARLPPGGRDRDGARDRHERSAAPPGRSTPDPAAEAQCACLAGTRRKDPDFMERPGDRGHGRGGAGTRPT